MDGEVKKIVQENDTKVVAEYFLGDVVFLKSKNKNKTYVAQICGFIDKPKCKGFKAVWYYSKTDVLELRSTALDNFETFDFPNELFLSNHTDIHPLNTILSHCYGIHGWDENFQSFLPSNPVFLIGSKIAHDYFCRYFFDVKSGLVTMLGPNETISRNGFTTSQILPVQDNHNIVRTVTGDGSVFDGQLVNGCFQGSGRMLFSGGGFYVGGWLDNKFHGDGQMYASTGFYQGLFVNGLRHGWGHYEVLKPNKSIPCGRYLGSFAFNKYYSFDPINPDNEDLICTTFEGIHDKNLNKHMMQAWKKIPFC